MHRSSDTQSYAMNVERYSTLTQLLSEMDGVANNDNIIVIAATNREDLLDAALVRPGRFDYKIMFASPDVDLRFKLYKLYLEKYKYDNNSISEEIILAYAKRSESITGAVIESIVNDAATSSFSKNKSEVQKEELEEAYLKNIEEFKKFKKYELKNSQY